MSFHNSKYFFSISALVLSGLLGLSTDAHAGKKKLTLVEWTDAVAGNTIVGPKEAWFAYFREDGSKIVSLDGKKTELKWRRNDDGVLCEVMLRSRKELCHDDIGVKVTEKKGIYRWKNKNGARLKLTIEEGNSRGL